MMIQKMTATFGKLERDSLELAPGLTVISTPNEGGKSTWAAFIRASLYGINTREHDRSNYLAEKNRYTPWSGSPMEGELQALWKGENITLRRFSKGKSPFGGFQAIYTDSGEPVPGLTKDNAGPLLAEAGRDLYERSAFVGQGKTLNTGGTELERRITSLATTGEEEISFSETQQTLKDWLNRRRSHSNQSRGLLPQLDAEIQEIRRNIGALEDIQGDLETSQARMDQLEEEKLELENGLELYRKAEQELLNQRFIKAKDEWMEAMSSLPRDEPDPVFGNMTAEEVSQLVEQKVSACRAAEAEEQRRKEARARLEQKRRRWSLYSAIFAVGCVFAFVLAVVDLARNMTVPAVALAGMSIVTGGLFLFCLYRAQAAASKWARLTRILIEDPIEYLEAASAYKARLAMQEQARARISSARRLLEELAAQGGQDVPLQEVIRTPARSKKELKERLSAVYAELESTRRTFDVAQGRAAAIGNIDTLYSKLDALTAQRAERQREYDAIACAMDALTIANNSIRRRFSPELNRTASELFARLTGGRYAALELTRAFEAAAIPSGEFLPRSSLALSRGTVEQLYLAVRLAVCQMVLSGDDPPPLILDDALANFDDCRMELALELLKELAQQRQIILFTCHSREVNWARRSGVSYFRTQ